MHILDKVLLHIWEAAFTHVLFVVSMHIAIYSRNESTDNEVRPSDEVAGGKEPTQLIRTLGRVEIGDTEKGKFKHAQKP